MPAATTAPISRLHVLDGLIEDACDEVDARSEVLAETVTQHRSETALYGDSWPGAQPQIARMHRALSLAEARLHGLQATRDRLFPVQGPEVPPATHCDVCGALLVRPGAKACDACEPF